MKIGVDLDGCVYDFSSSHARWLKKAHNIDVPVVQPDRWNTWESWGMDFDLWNQTFVEGVAAGEIFRDGEPEVGARSALEFLHESGHTLHIVTHRTVHPRAVQSTHEWLTEHSIPFDTLTIAKDKTIVPVNVFIEDNVDNANALADAGTLVALMDRPWNRHAEHRYEVQRVFSWGEFALLVDRLAARESMTNRAAA